VVGLHATPIPSTVPDGDGETDPVGESVGDGEFVGESVGDGELVGESVGLGDAVGESVGDGESVGESVGLGDSVGESVGDGLWVGLADVGEGVGAGVGLLEQPARPSGTAAASSRALTCTRRIFVRRADSLDIAFHPFIHCRFPA
jgi:hypothetical protein